MSNTTPVAIGDIGIDLITGMKGVVTARKQHLYGCVHLRLERTELNDKGQLIDGQWFDEQRIEKAGTSKLPVYEPPVIPFPLGSQVRDKVSGFKGIATTFCIHYNGHADIAIDPGTLNEGEPIPGYLFELSRIEVIEAKKPPVSPRSTAPSGSIAAEHKRTRTVERR